MKLTAIMCIIVLIWNLRTIYKITNENNELKSKIKELEKKLEGTDGRKERD